MLVRSHKGNAAAVARRLKWPQAKVLAAIHYAEAFPDEIDEAIADNAATDFKALKQMLPQTLEFIAGRAAKR